jgi:hypothetical protein
MTVQIVDPNPQPDVIKYVVYYNCGCKLSYVPNDVKERHGRDYSGSAECTRYIKCAKCNKEVVLESW